AGARIAHGAPGALVPDNDRATAILPLGDLALEAVVADGMVLDMDGQGLHRRVERWPLGHGPAEHHAIEFEPEVVMQVRGPVLLDDELQGLAPGREGARGLGRLAKVAFGVV